MKRWHVPFHHTQPLFLCPVSSWNWLNDVKYDAFWHHVHCEVLFDWVHFHTVEPPWKGGKSEALTSLVGAIPAPEHREYCDCKQMRRLGEAEMTTSVCRKERCCA